MSYYFSTTVEDSFEGAIDRVKAALGTEGFGVLTEIDVKATVKEKLGEEFRPYRILGACNPKFAHQALQLEDKVGTMLPCNVIAQELSPGTVEISAVNPVASMQAIGNDALGGIATEIQQRLKRVIDQL